MKNETYGLADLTDASGHKLDVSKFASPNIREHKEIPDELKGKNFAELYKTDDLEHIRKHYPAHYEHLKNEHFNTKNK